MEEKEAVDVGTVAQRRALLGEALASRGRGPGRSGRSGRGRSTRLRAGEFEARPLAATVAVVATGAADAGQQASGEPVARSGSRTGAVPALAAESPRELDARLRGLARTMDLARPELVDALVAFDAAEGWRLAGARSCVAWQVVELRISRTVAYDNLRVGRALIDLPTIAALFRAGDLTFSQVLPLVSVATPDDDRALAIVALDRDPEAIRRHCAEYRWGREAASEADERERHARRYLRWKPLPDGSSDLRLALPPELAGLVAEAVERVVDRRVREARAAGGAEALPGRAQLRADALVELVRAGATGTGIDARTGVGVMAAGTTDLVVAVVDAEALEAAQQEVAADVAAHGVEPGPAHDAPLPLPLRAAIQGILGGGVSASTARRLAAAGSLVTMILKGGEPVAMGRKRRLHSPAQRRAVFVRDGGCTFPGCGRTTNLQPHHIVPWAWGGDTSVRETVALCTGCHAKVHDEGWVVTRIGDDAAPPRHPRAAALLAGADERTRAVIDRLDARRPKYRFELSAHRVAVSMAPGSVSGSSDLGHANGTPGTPGTHRTDEGAVVRNPDAPHVHPGDIEDPGTGGHCREARGAYAVRGVPVDASARAEVPSRASGGAGSPASDQPRYARLTRSRPARSRRVRASLSPAVSRSERTAAP